MPLDNKHLNLVAEQILDYLEQHPQATDTARGIYAWWLRDRDPSLSEGLVIKALQRLVDEGSLDWKQTPGGDILYKRRTH